MVAAGRGKPVPDLVTEVGESCHPRQQSRECFRCRLHESQRRIILEPLRRRPEWYLDESEHDPYPEGLEQNAPDCGAAYMVRARLHSREWTVP